MNLNPFPALDPKASVRAAGAEPYDLQLFPNAGYGHRMQEEWSSEPPTWAKPQVETIQALRTRVPVGLRAIDDFLGGGVPSGSAVTVIGPPFGGKRTLACQFLASGLAVGAPALALVTDGDLGLWRHTVASLCGRVPEERKGFACFLDLGSEAARIGRDPVPLTERILANVEQACESLPSDRRRFVLDSFTTVVALCGYHAAVSMLMRLSALLRREGATSLVLLEAGAHSPLELQLVKRQADGAIEFRQFGAAPEVQVTGLGMPAPSPWLPGRAEPPSAAPRPASRDEAPRELLFPAALP